MPDEDAELQEIRMKMLREMMRKGETNMAGNIIELTDDTFEEALKKYPKLVVDCWAPWCAPCRMIAPIIDKLSEKYSGQIQFAKLNTDQNQKTAMQNGIMSIPTLLIYRDGKLVDRVIGALPEPLLEKSIIKNLL